MPTRRLGVRSLKGGFLCGTAAAEVQGAEDVLQSLSPFDEAREAYAAMVAAWPLPVAQGDWGGRLASDVERLRPGIKIPTRLQRDTYLVNFIGVQFGEPKEMDFHSVGYCPLFRLPLESAPEPAKVKA